MEASSSELAHQRQLQLDALMAKSKENAGRGACSQSISLIALVLSIIGIVAINFHAAENMLKAEIENMNHAMHLPQRHWKETWVSQSNNLSVASAVATKSTSSLESASDIPAQFSPLIPDVPATAGKIVLPFAVAAHVPTSRGPLEHPFAAPAIASPESVPKTASNAPAAIPSSTNTTIPRVYGANSAPLIAGYGACASIRAAHSNAPARLVLGPAGLFNTGTNYLEALLRMNCKHSNGKPASLWQVPWGKHNPIEWRGSHYAPSGKGQNISLVMPVVMIKDPLTWMKSMCRKPYAARFKKLERCPSPVEATSTVVSFQRDRKLNYKSLLHLWGQWNRAYIEVKIPHLVVRYEDVLFNPVETVSKICACTGGAMSSSFKNLSKQAKSGKGHGDGGNDRARALAMYGDPLKRVEGYSGEDLDFIRKNWDADLVRYFHYFHGLADEMGEN